MGDTDDDARYPPNPYSANYRPSYGSSQKPKVPLRNTSYAQEVGDEYRDVDEEEEEEPDEEEEEEVEEEEPDEDEEEEEEEEDEGEGEGEENGVQRVVEEADEEPDEELEEDEDTTTNNNNNNYGDDDDDDDEDDDDLDGGGEYNRRTEDDDDPERHRKKRKLKNLALGYEFAPRVAAPAAAPVAPVAAPKPTFGGRHSPADWTEHATFVLLDAWGDRFLQLGRKSLRSDEWIEVAKKVSMASKTMRTDTQCRNRLDTLKKKYKKERMKLEETSSSTCKWVYFKKMDMLMNSSPRQPGLSCGLDSGEYVFMNPRVYLNRSNGLDEMRDSPGNSESSEPDDDDNSDDLPPKRTRFRHSRKENDEEGSSFKLLADSIQKFGEIYEKIENSKRQQMLELEKMRMEFHRDLELQKRKILERAQAEIAKLRQDDDEEIDVSIENMSE